MEKMETAGFAEMQQMAAKIASEAVDSWMIDADQHEGTWGKDGTNPKECEKVMRRYFRNKTTAEYFKQKAFRISPEEQRIEFE